MLYITLFLLLSPWTTVLGERNDVLELFNDEQIFSDFGLDGPPSKLSPLGVCYGSFFVQPGSTYSVESTQSVPTVDVLPHMEDGKKYTLIMADPDAKSRAKPLLRSYLHWLVSDASTQNIDLNNFAAVKYIGPGPPKGTGSHRYIFLLFEQPGQVSIGSFSDSNRAKFDVGKFVKENQLILAAGTFFFAQNE